MSSYQWFYPPNVNFSALNAPRKENHICNLAAIRLQPLPIVVVVVFSCSVQCILDSWPTHGLQHTRFTISWSLLKLMSIDLEMPSNHLILCCPLLLSSIFPSIRVFSNESALHIRWPNYWNFGYSISPSNKYSGVISSGIDWFDFLAVQGTLWSLLPHYNLKASILSHPYMTTGKIISLTTWTFVGKVMSLLFNTFSRLAIAFLPRSKCLLISWLQSWSAVILEPPK